MERQDSYYAHCHVFVDDSNLWIEGQKYAARKLQLKDVDKDPRYRVDLGKFLDLVVGERTVADAFLYGSKPPPNDSVWKAAKERNFNVEVFTRAQGEPYGREKEVDMAMAVEITTHACQCDEAEKANTVFIIVTGDRDFTPPVKRTLKFGIPVELWAWRTGMSIEFRRLANTETLLRVQEIDNIAEEFSFTSFMSTRVSGDIDTARAIVFKDLPNNKRALRNFASDLNCLLRVFYITPIQRSGVQDVIVHFPKSKLDDILKLLKQLNFSHQAYSYAEYNSERTLAKHQPPQLLLTNRYQALSDIDTSDFETTADAITGSLNVDDIDELITQQESSPPPTTAADPEASCSDEDDSDDTTEASCSDEDDSDDTTEWVLVNKKAGAWTRRRKLKHTRCRWEIHCAKASECKYLHTDPERELFQKYPRQKFQFWKIQECTKDTPHSKDHCRYAHGSSNTWCLRCKSWGHSTDKCVG